MAKVIPLSGTTLPTKLHGNVFYSAPKGVANAFGPPASYMQARAKSIPVQGWTPVNNLAQNTFSQANAWWVGLDPAIRALWNAAAYPPQTGYTDYILRAQLNLTWGLTTPPGDPGYNPNPIGAYIQAGTCETSLSDFFTTFVTEAPYEGAEVYFRIYVQLSSGRDQNVLNFPPAGGSEYISPLVKPSGFIFIGSLGPLTPNVGQVWYVGNDLKLLYGFQPTWYPPSTGPEILTYGEFDCYIYVSDQYGKPALAYFDVGTPVLIFSQANGWLKQPTPDAACTALLGGRSATGWSISPRLSLPGGPVAR